MPTFPMCERKSGAACLVSGILALDGDKPCPNQGWRIWAVRPLRKGCGEKGPRKFSKFTTF
jgi:hypothetical protein